MWYRLAQKHYVTLGVFVCDCVTLCLAALSSQLCRDLSVRPLSRMSWANTQGWEVNWKQDVATAGMDGRDWLFTRLLD